MELEQRLLKTLHQCIMCHFLLMHTRSNKIGWLLCLHAALSLRVYMLQLTANAGQYANLFYFQFNKSLVLWTDHYLSGIFVICNLCRFSSLPRVVYQFKRLEILMANDNQISDFDAESLCQLPLIATLALQNNNISTLPLQLGNCTQLRFCLGIFWQNRPFSSLMLGGVISDLVKIIIN